MVIRLLDSGEQRSETRERQLPLITPDIGYQVNLNCLQTSVLAQQEGVEPGRANVTSTHPLVFGPRHTSHRNLVAQLTCLRTASREGALKKL